MSDGIVHSDPKFKRYDPVVKVDGDGTEGLVWSETPSVHAGVRWYRVRFNGAIESCREADLLPSQDETDLTELLAGNYYVNIDGLRRHITAVKLRKDQQLTDTLYAYGSSRTRLYPYQFIPLLKYLNSPYRRLLIADEVGLGKTIEAGYILQEELARGRLARILVVCPASLRMKWQSELSQRFDHHFETLNAQQALRRVVLRDEDRGKDRPLRGIVSYQSIRTPRFIEAVGADPANLDLLIVDEAHHCRNANTLQAQAVAALVEQSDSVLFLSATPVMTGDQNLFTLMNMLVPEEFMSEEAFQRRLRLNAPIVTAETLLRQPGKEPLRKAAKELRAAMSARDAESLRANPILNEVVQELESPDADEPRRRVELQAMLSEVNLLSNVLTRTKRKSVKEHTPQRRAMVPETRLSEYEQYVYDALSEFIFDRYQEHCESAARLVLVTYQRMIASSLPAAVRRFGEAFDAVAEAIIPDELEAYEDEADDGDATAPAYRPSEDPDLERLVRSFDLKRLEDEDQKLQLLLQAIEHQFKLTAEKERESRKLMVFSYFRRSLDYLERQLAKRGYSFVRIDGSVKSDLDDPDRDERRKRIERFRDDPNIDILLTSEVGSEGLDFQFCDTVINWDLPWNPMVVEQRIGRVDRIGQRSRVIFVVNLACRGTIEYRILHRLYQRTGIFERSIGELEPILGEIVHELERDLFRPQLGSDEHERILKQRAMAVEQCRLNQEQLETKAEELIGHDEYFRDKLAKVQRFGRYVGKDELRLLLEHELSRAVPGFGFVPDDKREGVYHMPYRTELDTLVAQELPRGDDEVRRFQEHYRRGRLSVAFDGEVAERHSQVEPLHAQHPLVRAIAQCLQQSEEGKPIAVKASLATDAVAAGPWFIAWTLVTETGFLEARSLMTVALNLANEFEPAGDDAAEQLLADLVRKGEPCADFEPPPPDMAEVCVDAAEARFRQRTDDLSRRRQARLESIRNARRSSVAASFDVRIERQRQRTANIRQRAERGDKGAQRILRAFEGRLEQLEAERHVRLAQVDELKVGTASFTLLGAGYVDVVSPS